MVFPVGAANLATNNDLGVLVFNTVTVSGNGYTLGGNDINISDIWQFTGDSNTISSNINITNAASASLTVSGGATGNIINGNIVLALSAGGDMNTDVNEDINHNGAITGSTDAFQQIGDSTWITSDTVISNFSASSPINVAEGFFQCRNNNCFGLTTNTVQTVATGTIQLSDAVGLTIVNNMVFDSSTSPQLNNMAGANVLSGDIIVDTSGTWLVQASSTLNTTGTITLNAGLNAYSSTFATVLDMDGIISGVGGMEFTNIQPVISGANTFDGDVVAHSGTLLSILDDDALGSLTGDTTIESGAGLYATVASITDSPEDITINGTGISSGGAINNQNFNHTFSGTITLGSDSTIKSSSNGNFLNLTGQIVGTGDLTVLGVTGAATTFDGSSANTYSGTTTVTNGSLILAKDADVTAIPGDLNVVATASAPVTEVNPTSVGQIDDNSNVTLTTDTGVGKLIANSATETIGSLAGNGTVQFGAPGNVLNIGANNSSTSFSGEMIDAGVVNKVGTGTFTIDGTLTAPFPTFNVNAGKLNVAGDYTASNFTANTGGSLNGSGSAGTTTINSGGTFNAGNSPGCMTVASLTLNAGANFDTEIAGSTACSEYDQTTVNGSANLGNATLNVVPSYTPASGQVFTIIQAENVVGTFNGLADNSQVTISGLTFRVNYSSTTVTLTYIAGTLAPTGQNSNQIALLALSILILGIAGFGLEYFTRRKSRNVF